MKSNVLKHLLLLQFFACCCLPGLLYAQTNGASSSAGMSLSKTVASPEVASLGTFGLIPANLYTGQANISVPLYEVNFRGLKVPISLSYATSGNRPDDHPGWTGLGWSLSAGGVIYRKVNGIYDENDNYLGPGAQYAKDAGYYFNAGRLPATYKNPDSIRRLSYDLNQSDPYADYRYDTAPDEFVFNFNGYSGVFYFYRATPLGPMDIKIRSNGDYKLKAEVLEFKNTIQFNDFIQLGRWRTRNTGKAVYSFKITDENGVQYIFGGTENSIEFSNGGSFNGSNNSNIPSSWHLTEINAPEGYSIHFDYERKGRNLSQFKQRNATVYEFQQSWWGLGWRFLTPFGSDLKMTTTSNEEFINITVQNPVYLSKITTPIQTISFKSSKSDELAYEFDQTTLNNLINQAGNNDDADVSCWQKLDEIEIGKVKKIRFNYINNSTRRLQLTGIDVQTLYDRTSQRYTFSYNPMLLPPYNSKKADHWGFYNGRSYAYDNNYLATREPDSAYMRAEILEKITYPTGGYTILEYEPHFYRKVAKQLPFSIETKTANLMAGGLRIKKVVSAPDTNLAPVIKEYFYTTDYLTGGSASSGVLAGAPQYTNFGTASDQFRMMTFGTTGTWSFNGSFAKVVDNNFLKLSTTNGNHITYSEVTEKTGGGYVVHKYSNIDNGYQDKPPFMVYTNFDQNWPEEAFISMDLYRGLELSSAIYNGDKQILKEAGYIYDIDTLNTNYQVPYVYRSLEAIGSFPLTRVSSCVFYTKPALLRKSTEKTYAQGSTTSFLSTEIENQYFPSIYPTLSYKYDNYKKVVTKSANSEGDSLKAVYTYPYGKIAANEDAQGIYKGMVDSSIIAVPLKEVRYKNNVKLLTTNTEFHRPDAKIFRPKYVESQQGTGPLETEMTYDSFDTYGNITQETKRGGSSASYIWDYNGEYPVAAAVNAALKDIAYTSFETESTGGWVYTGTAEKIAENVSGKKCLRIGGSGSLLIYLVKSGLTSSKRYTVSYWSRNGAYTVTGSIASKTGRSFNGWTYYEHTVANVTEISVKGTGYIDAVRLCPENAQMLTYTFEPLKGMTSQCDPNGSFIYYEYDSFGRLHVIRNQDGYITKVICYNYAGEQELCNEQIFYNEEITDSVGRQCEAAGMISTKVAYTVPAEKYMSNISVEDANNKARNEIAEKGQEYGNQYGVCKYGNDEQKYSATRDCPAGYNGTSVTFVVPKNTFLSDTKEDANAQALAYAINNAKANANANGECVACNVNFARKANAGNLGVFRVLITNTTTGVVAYNKTFSDFTDATIVPCESLPSGSYSAQITTMDQTLYVTVNGTVRQITQTAPYTWLFTSGAGISFAFSSIP